MYRCTIRDSDRAGGTLEFGLKGAVGIKGSLAFFLRSGVPFWMASSIHAHAKDGIACSACAVFASDVELPSIIWTAPCGNGTVPARLSQSTLRARNWALPSPASHTQTVDAAETLSVAAVCSVECGRECGVMGRCADLRWSCARQIHVLASRVCVQSCEGRSLRDTLVRMTRSAAPIKLSEHCLCWLCFACALGFSQRKG